MFDWLWCLWHRRFLAPDLTDFVCLEKVVCCGCLLLLRCVMWVYECDNQQRVNRCCYHIVNINLIINKIHYQNPTRQLYLLLTCPPTPLSFLSKIMLPPWLLNTQRLSTKIVILKYKKVINQNRAHTAWYVAMCQVMYL